MIRKPKGVEVDFYIPGEAIAIQVCYDLDNSDDTFDREVGALLKLSNVLECKRLMIIKRDSEQILKIDDKTIEIILLVKTIFYAIT